MLDQTCKSTCLATAGSYAKVRLILGSCWELIDRAGLHLPCLFWVSSEPNHRFRSSENGWKESTRRSVKEWPDSLATHCSLELVGMTPIYRTSPARKSLQARRGTLLVWVPLTTWLIYYNSRLREEIWESWQIIGMEEESAYRQVQRE